MVSEVRRAHDFIFSQIFIIYHIIFFFLFHSHFSEVLWLFYFIFIANWMSGSFQWDDKNVENCEYLVAVVGGVLEDDGQI